VLGGYHEERWVPNNSHNWELVRSY
jgi:hypothetical protein